MRDYVLNHFAREQAVETATALFEGEFLPTLVEFTRYGLLLLIVHAVNNNVVEYELLPYHPIGNSKRIALGLEPDGFTVPSKEFLKEKNRYVFVRRKA